MSIDIRVNSCSSIACTQLAIYDNYKTKDRGQKGLEGRREEKITSQEK